MWISGNCATVPLTDFDGTIFHDVRCCAARRSRLRDVVAQIAASRRLCDLHHRQTSVVRRSHRSGTIMTTHPFSEKEQVAFLIAAIIVLLIFALTFVL